MQIMHLTGIENKDRARIEEALGKLDNEEFDSLMYGLVNAMRKARIKKKELRWKELQTLATKEGFYSGVPVPLHNHEMTIADAHPAKEIMDEWAEEDKKEERLFLSDSGYKYVNSWYSDSSSQTVMIFRHKETGKFKIIKESYLEMRTQFLAATVNTGAAVWTVEAELRATTKLATHISSSQFKKYLLTGCFSEVSKKSGVYYMFRRSRPTLAIRFKPKYKVLCALCLHPVGYYNQTWAGAMCPTDEVIDHLLRMRGDEKNYWKKANQHPVEHPQSGV